MSKFYAFCSIHKKIGVDRLTLEEASKDCNLHSERCEDGLVYVKQSTFTFVDGKKKFQYFKHKIE